MTSPQYFDANDDQFSHWLLEAYATPTDQEFRLSVRTDAHDWQIALRENGRVYQTRNGRTRRLWFGPRKNFIKAFAAAQAAVQS